MCQIIEIGDREISSVRELIKHLPKVDLIRLSEGYECLTLDACLCQIDLDRVLLNSPYDFGKEAMTYTIKPCLENKS